MERVHPPVLAISRLSKKSLSIYMYIQAPAVHIIETHGDIYSMRSAITPARALTEQIVHSDPIYI